MNTVDALTATMAIQEALPGGMVSLTKINTGQALKVSVTSGKRTESELITLPTNNHEVIAVIEGLVWRLVPRKSSWERLGELEL